MEFFMKKRKLKKIVRILLVLFTLFLLFAGYVIIKNVVHSLRKDEVYLGTYFEGAEVTNFPATKPEEWAKVFKQRKKINQEYIGELAFESGLVVQNVVQGVDNDKYLKMTWDRKYSTQGAVFLDYRNRLSDQNLLLYGHYVYYDETKMFTPLAKLLKQEEYQANRYLQLKMENEIRTYEITNVFYYDLSKDTPEYYWTSYDLTTFDTYIQDVKIATVYPTQQEITSDDHWLTLQTCVRNHQELRQIILAKEIKSEPVIQK